MFRKVDTTIFALSPTRKGASKYPFAQMQPGDCWNVPEDANSAAVKTACSMARSRLGINVVFRRDLTGQCKWVVVRLS